MEFYSRIINKHDTEANWNNNSSFVPAQGELIVYDIDNNYNFQRIKMGDGITTVANLPFINIADERFDAIMEELEEIKGLAATGGSLQEISATPEDVLVGKTYNDSEGKVQAGALSLTGNASAANVLNGKTFYNTSAKTKVIGTMIDNGAVSESIGVNGSYTIPAGYHNGQGKITQSLTTKGAATYNPSTSAQTIASGTYLSGAQTIAATTGTATAANVLKGKTFNSANGIGLTGTMTDNGAISQSLAVNGSYTIPAGYHNGSGKVTQSVTTKAAATYGAKTSAQTIAAGQYLSGAQTIAAVTQSGLSAANIVKGKTVTIKSNGSNLWSVTGTAPMYKSPLEYGTDNFVFYGNGTKAFTAIGPVLNIYMRAGSAYGIYSKATLPITLTGNETSIDVKAIAHSYYSDTRYSCSAMVMLTNVQNSHNSADAIQFVQYGKGYMPEGAPVDLSMTVNVTGLSGTYYLVFYVGNTVYNSGGDIDILSIVIS